MTTRPAWDLAAGDVIGAGRTVVRPLGGGKRTEVHLARDDASGRLVVVKVLRPGSGDAARRALRAEADLVADLDHPGFPRLLDVVLDREPVHLVLEHVDGPRLSTHVRQQGPRSGDALVALGRRLADAVAYLHGRGYVHLDVKPSNTILGDPPRIIDLGVARTVAAAARVRGTVGSHRFQSPEQHDPAGFGGLTFQADVWGVGVTLAFAARGSSPFGPLRDERDQRRRLTVRDVDTLELPDTLPPALAATIRAAMAWEPDARPTARELADRLAALPRRRWWHRLGPARLLR